jgi:hypothetical protein
MTSLATHAAMRRRRSILAPVLVVRSFPVPQLFLAWSACLETLASKILPRHPKKIAMLYPRSALIEEQGPVNFDVWPGSLGRKGHNERGVRVRRRVANPAICPFPEIVCRIEHPTTNFAEPRAATDYAICLQRARGHAKKAGRFLGG